MKDQGWLTHFPSETTRTEVVDDVTTGLSVRGVDLLVPGTLIRHVEVRYGLYIPVVHRVLVCESKGWIFASIKVTDKATDSSTTVYSHREFYVQNSLC